MFIHLPLGIVYFMVSLTLFSVALGAIVSPFLRVIINLPIWEIDNGGDAVSAWWLPLIFVGGCVLLALTMHLAKFIGRIHGQYAKAMLVRK